METPHGLVKCGSCFFCVWMSSSCALAVLCTLPFFGRPQAGNYIAVTYSGPRGGWYFFFFDNLYSVRSLLNGRGVIPDIGDKQNTPKQRQPPHTKKYWTRGKTTNSKKFKFNALVCGVAESETVEQKEILA